MEQSAMAFDVFFVL